MQYTYAVGAAFVPNGGGIHARVTRGARRAPVIRWKLPGWRPAPGPLPTVRAP